MAALSDADGVISEPNVKLFTKACAKVGAKLPTAAFFKVVNGKIELQKIDLHGNTVFHLAVYANIVDPFYFLEFINGDKNPKNKKGTTPLHKASSKGHLNICELLIHP